MELSDGIEIVDLAVYIRPQDALVLGDVHLGFEEALTRQGVLLPRFQFKDTIARLEKILASLGGRVSVVVINGDLKHEFGVISRQEWTEITGLIDFLLSRCGKVAIVKGNHDIILFPIARKRGLEVQEHWASGGIYVSHGHIIPADSDFSAARVVIIGNEHPAVSIRSGVRSELFKCFLKGFFGKKELLVMPSFNQLTTGTDVTKERFISPFLSGGVDSFEVFVAADQAYYFGRVRDLK